MLCVRSKPFPKMESDVPPPPKAPSVASSSGISDMSDSSSRSSDRPPANRLQRLPSPATSLYGNVSETSDYQRSTPSPRDDDLEGPAAYQNDSLKDEPLESKDLGLGDEIDSDEKPYSFSVKSFYHNATSDLQSADLTDLKKPKISVHRTAMHAIVEHKLKVDQRLNLIHDPRIMFQKAVVKLEKIPAVEKSPVVVKLSTDRKRHHPPEGWFAKRSKVTPPPTQPPQPAELIRPAKLRVNNIVAGAAFGKFSGPQNGLSNPFLPPVKKSAYLFDDDLFESVDDVIEYESTEDDLEDEEDTEKPEGEQAKVLVPEEDQPTSNEVQCDTKHVVAPFVIPAFLQQECSSVSKSPSSCDTQQPKLRFPPKQSVNMIECKWKDCGSSFTTYGNLSDHLKAAHVTAQFCQQANNTDTETYQCLWEGCKVYQMTSCSRSWLEKHVPTHGGKFSFACIVSGCKMRFSSQKMLQRHVNKHFKQNDASQKISRKIVENNQSESTKNLKRAGVKLKFRKTVFSARIYDFFDIGIMSGIKHGVVALERKSRTMFNLVDDAITFHSKAISIKKTPGGVRKVHLRWYPENLLADEWVPLDRAEATRTVKICHLPEKSKVRLNEALFGRPPRAESKQRRKTNHSSNEQRAAAQRGGNGL